MVGYQEKDFIDNNKFEEYYTNRLESANRAIESIKNHKLTDQQKRMKLLFNLIPGNPFRSFVFILDATSSYIYKYKNVSKDVTESIVFLAQKCIEVWLLNKDIVYYM